MALHTIFSGLTLRKRRVALKFELCTHTLSFGRCVKKKTRARPFVVADVVIVVGDVRKEIKFVRNPPAVLSRVALALTVINFLSIIR